MMGMEQLRPQVVVDDVTMFVGIPGRVIQEEDGLLKHGGRMNMVINADKFALLHYGRGKNGIRCVPGRHQIEGHTMEARRNGEYLRLLGGDVNWFGMGREELAHARRLGYRVQPRAKLRTPSVSVLRVLVASITINAWVSRHVVQLLYDAPGWQPRPVGVSAVVLPVARLRRVVLDLPKKTPWRFIFEAEHVAMAHHAVSLWTRFLSELTTTANSAYR